MGRVVLLAAVIAAAVIISPAQLGFVGGETDWRADAVGEASGYRILDIVLELEAFGTRDFHTDESALSALLIRQRMEEIGLETELQEFLADGVAVVNVIGTLNEDGDESGILLFGAHYDSRNRYATSLIEAENVTAPGADDNASGVAAMLEIARVLAGCERYEATTRFVAFGAEERGFIDTDGLFGSAAYAKAEADLGIEYEASFILDMIGFRSNEDNAMTVVHNDNSSNLADSIVTGVQSHELDITVNLLSNESLRYSDHASFWNEGYPSVLVIEELSPTNAAPINPYYHTASDTADKLSVSQMEEIASALVGAALDLTDQGEDSYSFPYSLVLGVAGVVATALAVTIVLRSRKGVSKE
jgi:Zn-dependent M28 family amino/carboxypeptidase